MPTAELEVVAGSIVAYRLFDVAHSIDLARAEEVWARKGRSESSRGRLNTTPAKAVAFGVPPVALNLDPMTLDLGDISVQAAVTARLYDFGVVSLALRVPVAGLSWSVFTARLNAVDQSIGLEASDPL